MQRIPRKFLALAGVLVGLNVLGLVWIHHELTKAPKPTARILSMHALPHTGAADRLSLAFDRSMVPPEVVGEVEEAGIFRIEPKLAGEWMWSAPDKLEYMLAKPLPLGRVFTLSSTGELGHRTGRALEGEDQFELRTGSLALDTSEIIAIDRSHVTYRMAFNQSVDPGDLLRHVSFLDGKTSAELGEPACLTQTPQKELVLRFRRPASNRFRIVLDEELVGYDAEIGLEKPVVISRSIPQNFSLINAYARRPTLEGTSSVELRFTHRLNRDQALGKPTIVPAVSELTVYRSSRNLVVSGKFKAGGRYSITVPGTLLSQDHDTLGEDKSISVLIPEYRPRFQFTYRTGILSPLGNLNLDARAVNVEALELNAWRLHANNLIAHLHNVGSGATSRSVFNKKIELDLTPGEPERLVVDLEGMLPERTGIYQVRANAKRTRWTGDSALVTVTDLALTAKAERAGSLVWATSLRTGEPVSDVEVKAMTDLEKFRFDRWGKDVDLECAVTPGMPSFVHTRPELQEFSEKTIRWPGHWAGIETLKEIGLLDLKPMEFQGILISPREFMLTLLKPKLRPLPGETDVCVMWNSVTGRQKGKYARIDHYMWDEADTENGISAMGRVTGFSESICARFLAEGRIKQTGLVAPEDCITGDLYLSFISELKDRGIQILEEMSPIPVSPQ